MNIDGANSLRGVSCPTADLCVAVDSANPSNVLTSTNPTGGAGTWGADPVGISGFQSFSAVSCPSASLCVAVDGAGVAYSSTDPAASVWTDSGVVPVNNGLSAVSCPTVNLCVGGGGNGNAVWTTNPSAAGGGTWTQTNIAGSQTLLSISCATDTMCVAGDDVGNAYSTVDPTGPAIQWVSSGVSADIIGGMSCPTSSFCVAGDDGGNAITTTDPFGGFAAWTATPVANPGAFVNAVDCPSPSLCVVGDSSARIEESTNPTGGAVAWGTTILTSQVQAISCPTELLCVAVANSGNAFFGTQALLSVATAGTGSGAASGSGIACPSTCSKAHAFGTAVTLDAIPASGSSFSGWSGDCTGTGQCTTTMSASRSVVATFDAIPAAATPTVNDPPPAQPSAQLPPPVVGQSANAIPVQPGVLVKLPGTTRFVPLSSPSQIRFGAVIDARKGRVRIVIANGKGGTDSADFYQGVFRITQVKATVPIAQLTLVGSSFRSCARTSRSVRAAAVKKGKSVRHLWGEGSGAFRTKGRYASATIRGTRWLTDDRCNGTLVRVAAGAVTVRDLKRRKSLALRAPRTYFAAP